jgi:hypothetical protein
MTTANAREELEQVLLTSIKELNGDLQDEIMKILIQKASTMDLLFVLDKIKHADEPK